MLNEIEARTKPDLAHLDISDFEIVFAVEQISTVHLFDVHAYLAFIEEEKEDNAND